MCICGHAIEDHRDEERECSGKFMYLGFEENCGCVMYEEEEEVDE